MKKIYNYALCILCTILLAGCEFSHAGTGLDSVSSNTTIENLEADSSFTQTSVITVSSETESKETEDSEDNIPTDSDEETSIVETDETNDSTENTTVSLENIPEYSGDPCVIVNSNMPFFDESEITTDVFETYSELDPLGRCGVAYANICQELMPTESRESISEVYPSGWNQAYYDIVVSGYLWNRCHLIGFQLAGENANELNLITGTRYLNIDGMLDFENLVADYVDETDNHVLYRVTPIFEGGNLVASGVLMEGYSVEDSGEGVCFCVYCYNVQPGIGIDYSTGESWLTGEDLTEVEKNAESVNVESIYASSSSEEVEETSTMYEEEDYTYVLNTSSLKIHLPDCSSVSKMSDSNKEHTNASKQELLDRGYTTCDICNP